MSEPLAHTSTLLAIALAHLWLGAVPMQWHLHLWNPAVGWRLFMVVLGAAVGAAVLVWSVTMLAAGLAAWLGWRARAMGVGGRVGRARVGAEARAGV